MPGTRLFVGNLSYQTTEEELREFLAGAANITSVTLITERDSNRSKGFAFVETATEQDAQKVIDERNGQNLRDRAVRIDFARPRRGGGRERSRDRQRDPSSQALA